MTEEPKGEDVTSSLSSVRRPRVSINDVARQAKVSKATVSHVFNGHQDIGEATRVRVLDAAKQLGWRPNAIARALSRARTMTVGLVLARSPELLSTDPFFGGMLAGIEQVFATTGYALLLQAVKDEEAEERAYRQLANTGRVDGVIVTDNRVHDSRWALLQELGLIAITKNRPYGDSPIPWLDSNNPGSGTQDTVQHLLDLGHRKIAYVSGPDHFAHALFRREAFVRSLHDVGLTPIAIQTADFTAAGGSWATRDLLGLDSPPTAIVYANDLMAIGGMGVIQERGLSIPGDLSITGYDDIPVVQWINPPLTTVHQDYVEIGILTAKAILRLIDGEPVGDERLSAPQLIVRGSTASPRSTVT